MDTLFGRFKELWDRADSATDYNERKALQWEAFARMAWRIEVMPDKSLGFSIADRLDWTELVKCAKYAGESVQADAVEANKYLASCSRPAPESQSLESATLIAPPSTEPKTL